jgi:hypothetical protein
MVVFLQLEWGVWSGYEGCLRYRSVGLSKAVLLSYLLWMDGVGMGRRGNDELGERIEKNPQFCQNEYSRLY